MKILVIVFIIIFTIVFNTDKRKITTKIEVCDGVVDSLSQWVYDTHSPVHNAPCFKRFYHCRGGGEGLILFGILNFDIFFK